MSDTPGHGPLLAHNAGRTSREASGTALEVVGLSKSFAGTLALRGVRLQIAEGEVHAVIGQNGSGKSTLIKVLAGYHTPDGYSSAEAGGTKLELGNAASAREAGLRFVHQDLGLIGELSAIENFALGFGYDTGYGGRIRWRRQRAMTRDVMTMIGYPINLDVPVNTLSLVERTAIAIARALQGDADDISVLVLDEPTAVMPTGEVAHLFDIIRSVTSRGTAVLYVSHHMGEIFQIADRVTVLRDGTSYPARRIDATNERELAEVMAGQAHRGRSRKAQRGNGPVLLEVSELCSATIDHLSFAARSGEVLGFSGLTASGRDDVCDALYGASPRSGSVAVEGRLIAPMRPDISLAHGVGLVPSDRHRCSLVMSMTVRENLTLPHPPRSARWSRISRRVERLEAETWIQRLDIRGGTSETTVERLSGGNQQKVAVGKWLRNRPRVLLLDEPTQGIDTAATAEIHDLVDEAARDGMAVIVASSDEAELERLCDRVIVLRNGRQASEHVHPFIRSSQLIYDSLGVQDEPIQEEVM
jgi:ribose transport system ATP-binding protein